MPKRLTTADFHPEVMRLFDQYVHGLIDRRGFLKGAAAFAGSTGAVGLLAALSPNFAAAQQVAPADPRLKAEFLTFASPKGYGEGRGYLVRPADAEGEGQDREQRDLGDWISDEGNRFEQRIGQPDPSDECAERNAERNREHEAGQSAQDCNRAFAQEHAVRGLVLVAPYYTDLGMVEVRRSGFVVPPWDWARLRGNAASIRMFRSDADPWISQEELDALAGHLRARVSLVPGAGHFAELTELDILVEQIIAEHG